MFIQVSSRKSNPCFRLAIAPTIRIDDSFFKNADIIMDRLDSGDALDTNFTFKEDNRLEVFLNAREEVKRM